MLTETLETLRSVWPAASWKAEGDSVAAAIPVEHLCELAGRLRAREWRLGTIVATDRGAALELRYCFYATRHPGWAQLVVAVDPLERTLPSITSTVIAADWFEREIEDLFSIRFTEHPRLGDFVLHNDQWAEDMGLMRPGVESTSDVREERREWRPMRVLEEEGAFVMPIGPVYSGEAESALFLLETVGEDVVRAIPRLFFKYRAIEKLAEGRSVRDVLLLAERCAGTSAIGNGLAYCHAVERALGLEVPPRAVALRAFFAELERVRHHMTSVREVCTSTSLTVAASQALWLEEQLLRLCGELCAHRYLFGVLDVGGLMHDYEAAALERAVAAVEAICVQIDALRDALENTSSFLDRIEQVGVVSEPAARAFELVGPFARASGVSADMRAIQPYGPYASIPFDVPTEVEGDGYARLRVLFAEIRQSLPIARALASDLPAGSIRTEAVMRAGNGLGWTEAPRGASVQWADVTAEGSVRRYRLTPPSFRNWHGFHVATEEFAFQDFPIVLATLDLSVAENDR